MKEQYMPLFAVGDICFLNPPVRKADSYEPTGYQDVGWCEDMERYTGKEVTIAQVYPHDDYEANYRITEDGGCYVWPESVFSDAAFDYEIPDLSDIADLYA